MTKKWLNIIGILGLFIAGSIGGQLGLEAARAAFWQWSQTSINNQTADPTINWSEGMSPSSVNDSARAMMSRLAEQAADTSGKLTTAGGPVAFTVTTNQGFPNPPIDGQVIGVTFNVTNGTNPTLSVDAGTAIPLVSSSATNPLPGTLQAGMPYTLVYNAANAWWKLRDLYANNLDAVPLGGIIATTIAGNPTGYPNYVVAAGECLSTTTYAVYWAAIGSPAPGACPVGQFAVIDLRGRVLAGTDVMGGSGSAGRLTAAATGCGVATTAIGSVCNTTESHILTITEMPVHSHGAPISDPGHWHQLPYADPGHYHSAGIGDPSHAHSAGMYDPTHSHTYTSYGGFYNTGSLAAIAWISTASVNTGGAGTGTLVNGGPQGNNATYAAGTGVYVNSSNGANTTYSVGTGITFTGSGGNWSDYAKATGVRVSGVSLDNTNNTGSGGAHTVVQPTIVVNYLIRVL